MQMIGLLTKGIDNWGHVSIALFLMLYFLLFAHQLFSI
jgi:hypothetical protein